MAWVWCCDADELEAEDALCLDHARRSDAVCLTDGGKGFCTQGYCPQDGAHPAGGLVRDRLIKCPHGGGVFATCATGGHGAGLHGCRWPSVRRRSWAGGRRLIFRGDAGSLWLDDPGKACDRQQA